MSTLDSRSLGYTDCYAQRFAQAGNVEYHIVRGSFRLMDDTNETFVIQVADRTGKHPQQHVVGIDEIDGHLTADPARLEIAPGATVLWHAKNPATARFSIRGTGPTGPFDSSRLTAEALFTHPFGLAGEFAWADANGSPLGGIVLVNTAADGQGSIDDWRTRIQQASVVTIRGTKAEASRVEVVVGQTVAWIVEEAPGISITESQTVDGSTANLR